jgi:hypothetical protein
MAGRLWKAPVGTRARAIRVGASKKREHELSRGAEAGWQHPKKRFETCTPGSRGSASLPEPSRDGLRLMPIPPGPGF